MTSAIHNPFLDSLKKALHREASQVGFLAIEDVDRVFAGATIPQPLTWLSKHKTEDKFWLAKPHEPETHDWHAAFPVYTTPVASSATLDVEARTEAEALADRAGIDIGDDRDDFVNDLAETLIRYKNQTSSANNADGGQDEDRLSPENAWTILCETPDITSPEEYPDHALITFEQLRSYMERASHHTPATAQKGGDA